MNKLLLLYVLFLPSCGLVSNIESATAKLHEVADKLTVQVVDIDKATDGVTALAGQLGDKGTALAGIAGEVKAAVHAADKDQSGTIQGIGEIVALLGALWGIWKAHSAGATAVKAAAATDELYDLHVKNATAIAAAQPKG